MKSLQILLLITTLTFFGCGGDSSNSPSNTSTLEDTLPETAILDVNDTVPKGSMVGKVTIPTETNNSVKSIELIGDGAKNFTISLDGTITTKEVLKTTNNKLKTQKNSKKIYTFQIKIIYSSGKIIYINVEVTVYINEPITDTIKPIITLLGDSTVTLIQGESYVDAGATAVDDIDGDISLGIVVNSLINNNVVGTYSVTYDVNDSSRNVAEQVVRVVKIIKKEHVVSVVTDSTKPIITLLGESLVTIVKDTTYVDAGATAVDDVDGDISSKIVVHNSINSSEVGTYRVTYDVNDSSRNVAEQVVRTIMVTKKENDVSIVVDIIKPIITLLGESTVTLTQGESYIDRGAIAIDDVDGNISSQIVVHSSVNISEVGTYSVTYDVNDSSRNIAEQVVRTVKVIKKEIESPVLTDTMKPIITLLGNLEVTLTQGESYVDAGATAVDDVDGDISSSIVVNSSVDSDVIGTYSVMYDVNDSSNNSAEQIVRTVKVIKKIVEAVIEQDTTKPIITLLGDTTVTLTQGESYVDAGATAVDDVDGDISSNIVVNSSVNSNVAGTYRVTYDVQDSSQNKAIQLVRVVKVTDIIFNEFNVGFGGSSSFPFRSETEGEKIWVSAKNLVLDDNIENNSHYANIKDFNASAFSRVQQNLKKSKFITFWFTDGWKESWYSIEGIQALMDAGYVPVFSYWYFGDHLIEGMPSSAKREEYANDNIRVANFLKKLHGKKMILMEPEFNKKSVLKDDKTQHEFAAIISSAIDTIKVENPNLLVSLSMMDTGSRGVTNLASKCGYENCSLGDNYAWGKPEIVFNDLLDKLDFVSFHQMMSQFSRDYNNPGDWDNPNPRAFTDNELGVDFLADRISNLSKFMHEKYNKPVFLPYITVATGTWNDENSNNSIEDNEVDYYGWSQKAKATYERLNELKHRLKSNGLFGYSIMALFDNPRHDYGGYQYFMNNEYHLGIIGSSATDKTDIATYGDLNFKGSILETIFNPDSLIDIAHKYGKATQGTDSSYYYYSPASYAIDNNDSTNNHTSGGKNAKNWLQVELPNPTKVSKIVLQNRSHASRLTNAKVYVSNTPYTGTVDENNLVKILPSTTSEVTITLNPAKSGRYVLVKGEKDTVNDERHIHLTKLEVYGEMPVTPVFDTHDGSYLIQGTTTMGTRITSIKATDYQDDNLSYSIIGTVPFVISSEGELTVNGTLSSSVYTFEIEVSDGVNSSRTSVTINVTSNTVIADVLASGDVLNTKVTEEELIQATIDEIESLRVGDSLLSEIYENSSISYSSGNYYSQQINYYGDKGKIFPILYGNKNNTLALAGTKGASRISIFSSNPFYFFNRSEQLSYEPYMKRILAWLIANKPIDLSISNSNKTIALSFASSASDITSWFSANYSNWTLKTCNDNANLASCYADADLVILGNSGSDTDALALKTVLPSLLTAGKPLLYTHPNWGENALSTVIEDTFEFSFPYGGNYWADDSATWNSSSDMQTAFFNNSGYASINTIFTHFKEKDYDFDWSRCKDSHGVYDENNDNCSEVVGLSSEFQESATIVRNILNGLDNSKKNIFLEDGYRVQKLLMLTADKFRQSVSYPMDKVTTDDNDFMKSYYADHAIYNYRSINPKQLDMGNFSRSDFSHITPTTRRVQVNSKKSFRSTGAYALPGQTVQVTRNDSSDLTVKVFINTLRSGATHQFQKNGYNRPKYLQTPHFEIKAGETITFTSPYGGPLQLEFSKNDLPVDVTFSNVGEHAYWASTADNASFAQKLTDNEYEWAEIATAGFEVHSKLDKMVESVSDTRWGGTAEGLANAVVKYTSNYPHVLAGFKGEGVDVVPEIHDWANAKGLTIETIDVMKHMNADQATCGYGCSGNPYDAYWAFNPIGHGDIHEMGHSMQKMRFESFPNHAATNTFSYYTKSRYFANTSGENDCGGQPFKSLFETVQASVGQSDIQAYLKTNLWDTAGLGEQYLLKIEAMMHAEKLGKLQNGWHVLARVHILEREMSRAKQDWEAKKTSVGFSTYSLDEINAIGNNDWLIIAYSYAAELDYRNYFDMMGIPYSQKARDQIASFGFDVVPNSLFVSTDKGYCNEDTYGTLFDRPTLSIDGTTEYSY